MPSEPPAWWDTSRHEETFARMTDEAAENAASHLGGDVDVVQVEIAAAAVTPEADLPWA